MLVAFALQNVCHQQLPGVEVDAEFHSVGSFSPQSLAPLILDPWEAKHRDHWTTRQGLLTLGQAGDRVREGTGTK